MKDIELTINFTDAGTPFCLIAALIYLSGFHTLSKREKQTWIVIWLNLIGDLVGFFLSKADIETGLIYNLLLPAERAISLLIYSSASSSKNYKILFQVGIAMIVFIRIASVIIEGPLHHFQFMANTAEGLLTAILSYVFIRHALIGKTRTTIILFAFGIANFLYLILMASAMSAIPIAYRIDRDYSNALYGINTAAYIIWSATLIIAILWKKKT